MTDAIPVKRRDATSLGEFAETDRTPMRFLQLPKGYIDGLKMEWVSGTSLRVTSGAAYVPSLDRVLELPAAVTKAGLSLSANTWYHVYLFLTDEGADVEVVSTAPASAAYSGTARSKSGDTSRRYIGSIRTNASSQIMRFNHSGEAVGWLESPADAPLRILAGGTSATPTAFSTAGCSPVTASSLSCRIVSFIPAGPPYIAFILSPIDGSAVSTSNYTISVSNGYEFYLKLAIYNQSMQYVISSTPPSGGLFIDVLGYGYER